ncbi:PRC-barrel domain-containing protein [Loktanella sp. SALINAS62]|uniref:PRC-barrel domain-containing protein n=1 Tax=Loktanella sp. SALINAS62 TaxID=2706124 RepID=UPI001B8C1021|nr:PRC-barrel domain-containing protein [Loktanella sp. SALINAS62]MBS1303891.1 hypothetical protein [Loktanella sp. SALINAS62]
MNSSLTKLMLTTALCVPFATAATAQATSDSCQQLEELLNSNQAEMFDNPERIQAVLEADDSSACDVELVAVQAIEEQEAQGESDSATTTEGAELTETETLTVDLEDQVTVQGMVYLDRQPAEVDLQEGQTDVTVSDTQPEVTVTEGQAEIVVRQAPANVTLMMPQPTIRIEQPAPEIIITMPDPSVDITDSEPQVEVRQAEPTVTVMQAAPMVNLDLRPAPEGEEGSMQVTDRASGQTMSAGETGEPTELSDTTVNVTSAEPNVVYEQGEANAPTINRSEPTVRFESADPQVTVEQSGEPTIEMVQTGEPTVTINTSAEGQSNDDAAEDAMTESDTNADEAMMDAEQSLDETGENLEQTAEDAAQATDEATDEAAMAIDNAAENAEQSLDNTTDEAAMATDGMSDEMQSNGPDVQMEGFTRATMDMMTAEMLENAPLYGINGDQIGEVGQVLLGDNAQVDSLVLRVGGFLGLGEHAVAVPMDRLTILSDENNSIRVYIDENQDRLEDMPRFEG